MSSLEEHIWFPSVFRRNSDILYSQVNRACELLQNMRDNLLNDKKEEGELSEENE